MEKLELRINDNNLTMNEDELIVEGLVNKTESWSHLLGKVRQFREKIEKGAFQRAIENATRIDFLGEHKTEMLLATTENGSLQLWEDQEGLKMRAKIVPTSYGRDLFALIKNKMVNHMSFGFQVISDNWIKLEDGTFQRTVQELILKEISVVRNPAYQQSAISARGIDVVEDVEIPAEVDVEERTDETPQEQPVVEAVQQTVAQSIKVEIDAKQVAEVFNQFKNELLESLKSQKIEVPLTTTVADTAPLVADKTTIEDVNGTLVTNDNLTNVVQPVETQQEEKQTVEPEAKPEIIDNSKGVVDLLAKYKELQKFK